ncbi:uncharacterized protein [Cicer arietinum]|uniref:uncharacterized protein n=1 Tax=Cicer arietinum TaxID=3827 RepID=UPI003CC55456
MTDNATTFKELLVYIDHRYYGESMSFGSIEEAYKNTSTLGYLKSTQALANYAQVEISPHHDWGFGVISSTSLLNAYYDVSVDFKGTMFQPDSLNLKNFVENCYKKFGYSNLPRPRWITTYYGGHRLSTIIIGAATCMLISIFVCPVWEGQELYNLVASNIQKLANYLEGLCISTSIVALHTVNGMLGADKSDPKWSVDQRKKDVKIMKRWIAEYYVAELV